MQLPARIGKYELQEFLGGGMSHVYRARDTVIGRTVAVKILTEAGCEDAEAKARFLAEARMAGGIAHDNVLHIYDFGEDEFHRPFMVMEFLRGEDLRHAIKNGRTGDLTSKLKIAVQIARALEYIHSQKIVHRDIKPENIHINTAGVVKLMDFGIAKTEGLSMTRAGYVLGTPYYMSPEQVMGQNITEQVDVYAFGILLFELLTGQKPITGEAVERIFYSILNEPLNLAPLEQVNVPQPIRDLVARCTAKNPMERPMGFGPVCAALDAAIAELHSPTVVMTQVQGVDAPPAPGRPAWLLPAILALVVVLAAGLYFALKPKPPVPEPPKGPDLAQTLTLASGDMVLVPAGPFLFGENKEKVTINSFYIDKTEVTNRAYKQFCTDTKRNLPEGFADDKPDFPVVNVSFLDAMAFANWAGKRLPTDREWEKSARGVDGFQFPWGNDKDSTRANVGTKRMHAVTDFPNGASPYGVLNIVGNVWELINLPSAPSDQSLATFKKLMPETPPTAEEPWYRIRGMSYQEANLDDKAIFDFTTVPAKWKDLNIGFRCAKDAP